MRLYRSSIHLLAIACISFMIVLFLNRDLLWNPSSFLNNPNIQSFKTIFISIILEAVPFVLLGVLISSLLQVFISEQTINRFIPRNPLLGILFACGMGILFPVCECGMIPVVRRLILKGMPVYVAVVFILLGPILNPVVYAATYMAFRTRPEMAYSRMGLAFVVAAIIGLMVYRFVRYNPMRNQLLPLNDHHHEHQHDHHHGHSHGLHDEHEHVQLEHQHRQGGNKLLTVLGHASDEFFEMGKYLIFGSIVTALIQSFVDRSSLVNIGQGGWSAHLFMMGFAYILSLCSTSDAFVASSFLNTFSKGSLLTFLVFGPMLDLKSTMMLLSVFKTRFVLLLSAMIVIIVLVGSILFEQLFLT